MTQIDEFAAHINMLSAVIAQARRLFEHFKIAPQTKNAKLFVLIVLNELVRKCESVEVMAQTGKWSGIAVVTRSTFESFVDLLNCLTLGDDYVTFMIWMSLNQQRSQFQAVVENPESPYSNALEAFVSTQGRTSREILTETIQQMDEISRQLPDEFKNKNGDVIKRDLFRFELAGQVDEYNALYRRLSAGAHGRVSEMQDGIIVDDEIQWPPGEPSEPPLVAADCVCAMLLDACLRVAKAYKKPEAPLKSLAKENAALKREMYGG